MQAFIHQHGLCAELINVNKAVSLSILEGALLRQGQGWPVPTTAFPQPSRFHRNKTTRPQQPRLTRCTQYCTSRDHLPLSPFVYLQRIDSSIGR